MIPVAEKKALRKEMLAKRQALSPEKRAKKSAAIIARTLALSKFREAETIFAYASLPDEVQLDELLRIALRLGKNVAIPWTRGGGEMEAVRLPNLDVLTVGQFGIRSVPEALREVVPPEELDLALVPGAAFTEDGARLGLGGGYYDRYLGERAPHVYRLALAYDVQLTEAVIPMLAHDITVDAVLTEKREIFCKKVKR